MRWNWMGLALLIGVGALLGAGCTMCPQPPEDYAYGAYGGLIQRADRFRGRVGSAFSPAEAIPEGEFVPEEPYHDPVILEPQSAPSDSTGRQSETAEATPFDPGDILVSGGS